MAHELDTKQTIEALMWCVSANKELDKQFPEMDEEIKMTVLSMMTALRARKTHPMNCIAHMNWADTVGYAVASFPENYSYLDIDRMVKDLQEELDSEPKAG